MKWHIVIHECFEVSAAIDQWVKSQGYQCSFTHCFAGDVLPSDMNRYDGLIVMGGPQSPDTTDCPHFNAAEEIALIQQAVAADCFVLGVCLGAQLIGEALGARFEKSPHKEVGVYDITLTQAGKQHPIFSQYPECFPVGHWHNDMPGLTPESVVLASSAGCPRQIIQYAEKVYGFQCHFEFTKTAVASLIANCPQEFEEISQYIQSPEDLLQYDFSEINQYLFHFLDEIKRRYFLSSPPGLTGWPRERW